MHKEKILKFRYTFSFADGKKKSFDIHLDGETLNYIQEQPPLQSAWALLENEQCGNCPLKKEEHPYCPVALNIVAIMNMFENDYSYEEADVLVQTSERSYIKHTSLQRGLSSMLGIFMVSSGCPVMGRLKPMVRYHLPFATVEETVFRAASTYLLGQYFKYKKGQQPDWNLNGLMEIYREVQQVNYGMAERLRSIQARDANINALIVLDVFAKELPQNIERSLEPLSYLFDEQF